MAAPKSSVRKGVLLAGGRGSRMFPLTRTVNKHLLPVFDKPLIYYPLTTLILAGVQEIMVLSDPRDLGSMREALGDGRQWGLTIHYGSQARPGGIAEGLLVAADFVGDEPFCLILGDNIFYGREFISLLHQAADEAQSRAVIFTQPVADPQRYGVVKLDSNGKPLLIVEKPADPPSNEAVTGLYFYDRRAVGFARKLAPSRRGELEITDLNRVYLEAGDLIAKRLGRGLVWFDAGTPQNLLLAAELVHVIQARQRTGIAFPEEIAYRQGLINLRAFYALVDAMPDGEYRSYLSSLRDEFGPAA